MKLRNYQSDIIERARDSFRTNHKRPLAVLPCGAGKTVCFAYMAHNHVMKNRNNRVWFLVHRKELIDQTIATFNYFNIDKNNIFVGMVQTVSRHLEQYEKPSLIIFDEAHHATAKTWQKIVDYFADVPIIGLTATPTRLNGDSLKNVFDDLIIGVDSEWLMKNKYLCEYDYYAPKIISYDFEVKGSDFNQEQVTEFFDKSKIYGDVLKYIDINRKTIIYCPSIKFSKTLCDNIPNAVHFDGDTPPKERDKIIKDFRDGKIKILSNVDLIGEGFDVPDCDCVMLLRPTQSLALYIQQSMRCLRPQENKRAVIFDFVGNCFRHGMPTEKRKWSLTNKTKCKNINAEPDLLVRECKKCFRVYEGIKSVCPYCKNNNGKTKKQIEQDKKAELERIEKIEKKEELKNAKTLQDFKEIAKKRGYSDKWPYLKYNIMSRYRNKWEKNI